MMHPRQTISPILSLPKSQKQQLLIGPTLERWQCLVADKRFTVEIAEILILANLVDEQGISVLLEFSTSRGVLSILQLLFPLPSSPSITEKCDRSGSNSINPRILKLAEPLIPDAIIQSSLLDHPELVKHMLRVIQLIPDDDRPSRALSTSLILASKHNRIGTLQVLLNGIDSVEVGAPLGKKERIVVNPNIEDGSSLVWAARMGHVAAIRLLLDHGADASAQGGLSVLRAAEYGHIEALRVLLSSSLSM
jgi:hypothetical protein